MRNEVLIFSLDKKFKRFEKPIQKTAGRILKILKKDNVSVEIFLTDSRKMRFLNRKFRGKNKAADILSFEEPKNFISPASKLKKLGEIYLKSPIPNSLIPQLLIHGLLHLLGYTHKKKNDTITMETKENWVIRELVN